MRINWKVRFKNKAFWLALVPALLLLAQQVLGVFGVTFDVANVQEWLVNLIGAVFAILALFGVVVDPTTAGTCDSYQAMTYESPKKEE